MSNWSEEEWQLLLELVTANPHQERYGYWIDIADLFEQARVSRGWSSRRRGKDAIRKKWDRSRPQVGTVPASGEGAGSTTDT